MAQEQVVRAESWTHLQELLFEDAWDPRLARHRSPYACHGEAVACGGLSTSLMTLGGPFDRLEPPLVRNFRKYSQRDAVRQDDPEHSLAMGQKHGPPDRRHA